jgi:gelsolin
MKPKTIDIADSNIAGLGSDLEKQVRLKAAQTEAAWKNVGQEVGMKVWRIEKFCIVEVPKESVGTFYDGDSYIVLNVNRVIDYLDL